MFKVHIDLLKSSSSLLSPYKQIALLACVTYWAGTTAYPMLPDPGAGAKTVPGGRFVKFGWICGNAVAGMMSLCWGWLVVTICVVPTIGLGTTWSQKHKTVVLIFEGNQNTQI